VSETPAEAQQWRLGYYQARPIQSTKRYRVMIAGRRFGKTRSAIVRMLLKAVNKPGSWIWYVAPTYRMAQEITWEPLKGLVPRAYLKGKPNESLLTLRFRNGSTIALKGSDNPDSLRGPGLDLVLLDEFADIKPITWTEVLFAALSDKQGEADFYGTPKGFNWGYDLFQQGQDPLNFPDWQSWQFTTLHGGRVTPDEVRLAKATLDARTFRQEYKASFEALKGQVYDAFSREQWPYGNRRDDIVDFGATLHVGMDFNVNPMCYVVVQSVQGRPEVLDAVQRMTSNTEEIAKELKERYPDRHIIVHPDPSGKARSTSAPMGQTDFSILQSYGFEVRAPNSAPLVVDRINNTQSNLQSGNGDRRATFHPRTLATLGRALEGLTYKEGTSQPDKTQGLDHITDALGYVLWSEFNLLAAFDLVQPGSGPMHSPYTGE